MTGPRPSAGFAAELLDVGSPGPRPAGVTGLGEPDPGTGVIQVPGSDRSVGPAIGRRLERPGPD